MAVLDSNSLDRGTRRDLQIHRLVHGGAQCLGDFPGELRVPAERPVMVAGQHHDLAVGAGREPGDRVGETGMGTQRLGRRVVRFGPQLEGIPGEHHDAGAAPAFDSPCQRRGRRFGDGAGHGTEMQVAGDEYPPARGNNDSGHVGGVANCRAWCAYRVGHRFHGFHGWHPGSRRLPTRFQAGHRTINLRSLSCPGQRWSRWFGSR